MTHHLPQEELAAYMLHALPVEDQAAASRHLRACHCCRTDLAIVRELLGLYAGLASTRADASPVRERLLDELARLKSSRQRGSLPWLPAASRPGARIPRRNSPPA